MADETRDLEWLARQYVLGELDETTAAGFEACLEHDEAAAAAVASAVRLLAAIGAARPQPAVVPAVPAAAGATEPSRGLLAGRGAAVGILATAVALGGLWLVRPVPPARSVPGADASAPAAREVAVAGEGDTDEAPESDDVPGWLLTAVALEAEGSDGQVREN